MSNFIDEFGPLTISDEDDTDVEKDDLGGIVDPAAEEKDGDTPADDTI